MSTLNLRKIMFPRPRGTQTTNIANEIADLFRLNKQQAEKSGFGKIRTREALQDVINKNKQLLEQSRNSLSDNQIRDLKYKIGEDEKTLLKMGVKKELSTKDIEKGVEADIGMIKGNNVNNPYQYVKEMKSEYEDALSVLDKRIEFSVENGLEDEVEKLEILRKKYQGEKNKYSDIKFGFEGDKYALSKYSLILEMSRGRVNNMEFVSNAEKAGKPNGVRTNVRGIYQKKNEDEGEFKLSEDNGINIRLVDTKTSDLPEDRAILFGGLPHTDSSDFFQFEKGITYKDETIPDQYVFKGDMNIFNYSNLERVGAENREMGDVLRGSNDAMYYVDKNKDLRPINSKKTFDILKRKNENLIIKDLTKDEEEGLSYLVKEPFDIFKSLQQRQELGNLASSYISSAPEKAMELGKKSSVSRPAWSPSLRPAEYEAEKQTFLHPVGESKLNKTTRDIFSGVKEFVKYKGY